MFAGEEKRKQFPLEGKSSFFNQKLFF